MNTRSWPRFFVFFIILGYLAVPLCHGQGAASATLPIMPLPSSATRGAGEFVIDGKFGVGFEGYTEPRLTRARLRFLKTLNRETGLPYLPEMLPGPARMQINTGGPSAVIQQLGEDESYRLEVTTDAVHLNAPNPLGVMHGLQTFLQLVHVTPQGFAVPAVTIEDKPRFPWRGLMIDVGRHFIPLPAIERNIDAMEAVKLNVFHWHLSDDQGFRAESKLFPLLQGKGSDGMYYTQEEIRHTVEYARDRGIRVVPEFDMPAHAVAWFVGYPQLASGKGPYIIERHWGVFDPAMDPSRESTFQFLNQLIGEMVALFPDAYFHIGGDECDGKEWDANPRITEFKKSHHLADDAALQAYFSGRVSKLVVSHHRIPEGWDEVLQPDTPKDVVIQSWRGRDSLLDAARRGYRGLLSNGYYIDLNQPASEHYLVDPLEGIADKLTPEQVASVLGGEATMWSEFVNGEIIDSRVWPRTAAIAERLWSPANVRDVDSMYQRMAIIDQKLQSYGIQDHATSERMLQDMSGDPDPEALKILASVVQPPKGYARGGLGDYTSLTPLNHLVDAVSPESNVALEFQRLCERIVAHTATDYDQQQVREWLTLWLNNDERLEPKLDGSDLMRELKPVSQSLHRVAEIGLASLDALGRQQAMPAETQHKDMDFLVTAEKPQAVLLIKVIPAVESLVKAVRTTGQ